MAARKATTRGKQTRQHILDAAMELFSENGYRGTGLMAIGQKAGVTHAAVLYHFGSSEGLLLAVLDERLRRFEAEAGEAFDGEPIDMLRSLPAIARFNLSHPELTKMFVVLKAENLDEGQPAHEYFVTHLRTTHALYRNVLEAGVALGQFRADLDVDAKAAEIVAFIGGAEADAFLDGARLDLVELYQGYAHALIRDVAASPA